VLDAVGTEGGSGTAFIVITDDDIVTSNIITGALNI
jgi:hypothetical protein